MTQNIPGASRWLSRGKYKYLKITSTQTVNHTLRFRERESEISRNESQWRLKTRGAFGRVLYIFSILRSGPPSFTRRSMELRIHTFMYLPHKPTVYPKFASSRMNKRSYDLHPDSSLLITPLAIFSNASAFVLPGSATTVGFPLSASSHIFSWSGTSPKK